MYIDSSGHVWWVAIGALVGAVIGASVDVISQLQAGKGWDDLDWMSIGISAGTGAISGAIGATGLGLAGQVVTNALINGAESVLRDVVYGNNVDIGKAAISLGIGGLAGFLGGSGLKNVSSVSYGRLVSNGTGKFGVYTFKFTSTRLAETMYKEFIKGAVNGALVEFILEGDVITAIFEDTGSSRGGGGGGGSFAVIRMETM